MFSPYYAWARRGGPADPLNHCCLNVVLYGRPARWAMTERGRARLQRDASHLAIGPSALQWEGDALRIDIAERATPWGSRIAGTVRLHPQALETRICPLDAAGRHRWQPIAPCARAEVALHSPALRWSGPAYFDSNAGDRPLEADFRRWDWARAPVAGGAAVLYEATRLDGSLLSLAMRYAAAGGVADIDLPPPVALPRTGWGVARATRADGPARIVRTLEDAPFYARSVLQTRIGGEDALAMHESLSLDRFRLPVVQAMLPFRMPRRA